MDSLGFRANERDMQPYQRDLKDLAYQVLRALCFDTLAGRSHRVSDVLRFTRDAPYRAAVLENVDDPDVRRMLGGGSGANPDGEHEPAALGLVAVALNEFHARLLG
jgi:hypothetical protein